MVTFLVEELDTVSSLHMECRSIVFFFIGGGMGYENEMFPIYSDFRSYFVKKRMRVNPWIEIKLGVDALNGGCYLSPSFGLSVPLAKDYAFSVAFAYGSNPSYGENNIGLRITFQF